MGERVKPDRNYVQAGDIVLLVGKDRKEFIFRVASGQQFQSHRGVLDHEKIIGQLWGDDVETHLGYPYLILPPSLEQIIRTIKRTTQIMYPKDIGYLMMKMNIGPGTEVVEAGTGSGAMTVALARMVQPHGRVITYETHEDIQSLAQKNVNRVGLSDYVTFKLGDIAEGIAERGVDALFLDVREPWLYLQSAHAALKGGGFFGALLPTTNQVTMLLYQLRQQHFGFIEVEELILRPYKAVTDRFRPMDRIVGHTGYLIFARKLIKTETASESEDA
jgi:tRNA (adenine57-N1/adenine58-N1)-methyltransferase catalytic subunit